MRNIVKTQRIKLGIFGLLIFIIITGYGGLCGIAVSGNDITSGSSGAFSIVTYPATDITYNSATLNGTVNPNGINTYIYFQWGKHIRYTNTTKHQLVGSGMTSINVSDDLTKLSLDTQYNFRLVARRGNITIYGVNQTFTTELLPPTCTTNAADNVTTNSATLNGTVNPNGANVTSCYFDYGTSTSYGISTTVTSLPGSGSSPISVTANVSSLTLSQQYNFRVVATNAGGTTNGLNQTFNTTALPPPTCTTNAADNVTTNSAILNGTVNPNGANVTSCYFDYGTSTSYGISATVTSLPGSGSSPISVTANVLSLSAGQQYNFRVVAINAGGTNNGLNQTFNTTALPPTCTTNAADNVTTNSATLNGTVNPNGVNVTFCYFDYGTSTSYGISATVTSLPGSGSSPISVTANVSSLSAGQQYNFRVVATNAGGTTNGLNQTFNTSASAVDDYCWVTNQGASTVTRIQKSTSATTNIMVGTTPAGVAVDETYCWVTNQGASTVTRIQKSTSATTNIAVGTNPVGVAVDETYCWVANYSSGNVTRILKSTLATTNITVGSGSRVVAVDGTYCWVANDVSAGNVTRIVKSTLATTNITVGSYPEGIAVDETYCWVSNNGGTTVTRILKADLSTTNITVGSGPRGVAVDETYCWVANQGSDNVTRITKSTSTTTNIAVGATPYGIAVDGAYCWVANFSSNNVTRILKSDSTTTTITVGTNPWSMGDMTGYAYDNYSRVP